MILSIIPNVVSLWHSTYNPTYWAELSNKDAEYMCIIETVHKQ
jgi:hypothetical protein